MMNASASVDLLTPQPMREHPRVAADFVVRLLAGTREVLARAVDLSLAGVALHDPAGEVRAESVQRVTLCIPGEAREVELPVRMARRSGSTVAVAFSVLDWDDLFTLARYLSPRL